MSEYTWVKTSTLETILARLNNIKIKFSRQAKKASVKPYGSGTGAGINITLPKSSGDADEVQYIYVITSNSGGVYKVDLYDSPGGTKKGTGVLMFLLKHIGDDVPYGHPGVCLKLQCSSINLSTSLGI